jgi:hypothetical protein
LNNPLLRVFRCIENQITELDFTGNSALEVVYCGFNLLTTLDFSHNPLLEIVYCVGNTITEINVSQNPNLMSLDCAMNNIIELDFSQNPALELLSCYDNNLTVLDLSLQSNLVGLYCFNNQIKSLNIKNGNNINMDRMLAYNNQLTCIQVDDVNYAYSQVCEQQNYFGWCKDEIARYSENCLLDIKDLATIDFQLFPNPAENMLNIQSTENIENVKIYSTQGFLVKEVYSKSIDVSQLSAGMYFAQITLNGKSFTKKFIKE